ncbi:uncharacterized protein LOC133927927 [Phragmites australis]|uniref:uncharacterized protein LOC133927927 n=1 Tax=Phragmites australis TaxID=29695 RepID=UPI002D772BC1|nr:uncharacterized protein LOC133927927 [Phragmites australis]
MDCTNQPVPDPEPSPATAAVTLPQEATGDSESDTADLSSVTDWDDNDDAESCSGGYVTSGANGDSDEEDVTMEGDVADIDSKMAVPWWRRTLEDAAEDDGGCAPAVAVEGGAAAGGGHAAESNRLFWEACIAHGY